MSANIAYRTDELARYFSRNRIRWEQFYESERAILGRLGLKAGHSVLDIGCGCGGLGMALQDKFGVTDYTGVEINGAAAAAGRVLNPGARILEGDVLEVSGADLRGSVFDLVVSLSCVDWNVCFHDMLAAAWRHVRPGGFLVLTLRLTDLPGCSDMDQSYQFINFHGARSGERAAYVVLNARNMMDMLYGFDASAIEAYGYWGAPSASAVTPYARLCFCAVSVRRRDSDSGPMRLRLDLPPEIRASMEAP